MSIPLNCICTSNHEIIPLYFSRPEQLTKTLTMKKSISSSDSVIMITSFCFHPETLKVQTKLALGPTIEDFHDYKDDATKGSTSTVTTFQLTILQ